jgi:hypothetical protein
MVCIIFDPRGIRSSHLQNRARPDQQRLMKKGQGWIIHILDFVEEENGHLIVHDQGGVVVRDAWCVTYPGASGDA